MNIKNLIYKVPALSGEYPEFNTQDVSNDPIKTFYNWFEHAVDSEVLEPSTFVFSTVNSEGVPSSRIVNLRDMTTELFIIGSNSESRKGEDMNNNPNVAMTFYWPEVGRQVRIVGIAEPASSEENKQDLIHRNPHSKALSIIAKQSQKLSNMDELDQEVKNAKSLIDEDKDIHRTWTLYKIMPTEMEFFQARKDLAHIRLKYEKVDGQWQHGLLWP